MAARRRRRGSGSLSAIWKAWPSAAAPRRRRRAARKVAPKVVVRAPKAAKTPAKVRGVVSAPAVKPRAPRKKAPAGRGASRAARYAGAAGSRPYHCYIPSGLRRTTGVPLLILLHGCLQTPAEFAEATRFNQLADRHGFLVVYPEQTLTHNLQRCWNWFDARHHERSHGEPAILAGIAREVMAERTRWRIDHDRVYVAGLSAGGAMALVLGATYPDLFAAIGVHSAPPYRSATSRSGALTAMAGRSIVPPAHAASMSGIAPMILFQGRIDSTVRVVNAVRITDQWRSLHERRLVGDRDPDRITRQREITHLTASGRTSTVTRWYSASGRKLLESWQVERLAHAWSGGRKGVPFSDPQGPRATTEMWRFLSGHRLNR